MKTRNELLDIFKDEKDKKDTDLLAMSDFFDVFIKKIEVDIGKKQFGKNVLILKDCLELSHLQ